MPRYALTDGIKSALRRGLRLHEEGKSGDGLKPATVRAAREGIESGWDLAKLNRAVAWFARHEASKTPGWDKRGDESPAFVAWLLWGGNPAAVERIRDRAAREEGEEIGLRVLADDVGSVDLDSHDIAKVIREHPGCFLGLIDVGLPVHDHGVDQSEHVSHDAGEGKGEIDVPGHRASYGMIGVS